MYWLGYGLNNSGSILGGGDRFSFATNRRVQLSGPPILVLNWYRETLPQR